MKIAELILTAFRVSALLFFGTCLVYGQENLLSVKGFVEQIVIHETPTRYEYVLATKDGNRYNLTASQSLSKYANQHVSASATLSGNQLNVINVTAEIKPIEETQFVSTAEPTFGKRKVLVLLVNFSNTITPTLTTEQARANVFTGAESANEYFKAASLNRFSLSGVQRSDGDVVGWLTIPHINDYCNLLLTTIWTQAADSAARDNGYEPNQYNSVIYVFPTLCRGAAGIGTMGKVGDTTLQQRAWFLATSFRDFSVIVHELGHNLGLDHASALNCSGTNIPADCQDIEYGDVYDAMAERSSFFFNNYYRISLGWLTGRVQIVTTSGDYNLIATNLTAKGNQVLQIPLKESDGSSRYSYFLEFRRPWSFDNQSANNIYQPVYRGVGVRFAENQYNGNGPYLIDTTPNTRNYFQDAPLAIGNTYTDAKYGVSITTLSTNPKHGARIRIQLSR